MNKEHNGHKPGSGGFCVYYFRGNDFSVTRARAWTNEALAVCLLQPMRYIYMKYNKIDLLVPFFFLIIKYINKMNKLRTWRCKRII